MQGKQPSGEGSAHLTQPWGEGCSPGCKRALFLSHPAVEDWADLVSTAGGDKNNARLHPGEHPSPHGLAFPKPRKLDLCRFLPE